MAQRARISSKDLNNLPPDLLKSILKGAAQLQKSLEKAGPRNDDELHNWVIRNIGVDIPRTKVCEDHDPPFKFLADLYFERVGSALLMANRGGSKTFIVAILHYLNSTYKPGCESLSAGATQAQADRAYQHLLSWITTHDDEGSLKEKPDLIATNKEKTKWKNGSIVECLPGTWKAMNGPHTQKTHLDEVEQFDGPAWEESQPVDTIVPTPSGNRRWGDLKIGDYLFGRNGKPTQINKVWELGERDVYEVELTDGRKTICCADHLWVVAGTSQMHRGVWKEMRTSELIDSGIKLPSSYKFAIPNCDSVEYSEANLPLDPYILGVLLGDGCFGKSDISFCSIDEEIINAVNSRLDDGYILNISSHDRYRIGRTNRSLPSANSIIDKLGLARANSFTKFIPDMYKLCSTKQRLDLIRGLMDTDGCAINGSSVGQFGVVSERLARDLADVVRSLGGRAIIRSKMFKSNYSEGTLWTLDISLSNNVNPFLISRKADRLSDRTRTLNPYIKSITPTGIAKVRCVGVDNEDGTYLTNDYIVTHNSRNITVSKRIIDANGNARDILGQDILTSTRKSANGRMQQLIDQHDNAIKDGQRPPFTLYKWCIWETTQEVPHCQRAPQEEREARLAELGRDTCETCDCHQIVSQKMPDGTPRTLDKVCQGKMFRSRGWRPLEEIQNTFQQNSPGVWDAQQECRKPETEGNYLPWDERVQGIRNFEPDPDNGPVYMSVDWGATNPSAVNWYQRLNYDTKVKSFDREDKIIPAGSVVCFAEIYVSEVGVLELAKRVHSVENNFRRKYPGFRVKARFADPQGKQQRIDFRQEGLPTEWHGSRDKDYQIQLLKDLFGNDEFYVDVDTCPNFVREIASWRADPRTGREVEFMNHCVSGDTLVNTDKGLLRSDTIDDGESINVLTQGGYYRQATWKHYGEREVYSITFDNGEIIKATDAHEWITSSGDRVKTIDLLGKRVPTQPAVWHIENQESYLSGVRNGLVYGDGTTATYPHNGKRYSLMRQYGDENCSLVERFFPIHSDRRYSPHCGVMIQTSVLPEHLKELPITEDRDYIRGFLAGLIAADGTTNKQGCAYVSSSKEHDIDIIVSMFRTVGVVVSNVECYEPSKSSYPNAKPNYRIWLTKGSLDETLLLKPSHRKNSLRDTKWTKTFCRKVISIDPAGVEPVFCCEEPVTNTWVTGTGILTSNCMSNFRYAIQNMSIIERHSARKALARRVASDTNIHRMHESTGRRVGPVGLGKTVRETLGV